MSLKLPPVFYLVTCAAALTANEVDETRLEFAQSDSASLEQADATNNMIVMHQALAPRLTEAEEKALRQALKIYESGKQLSGFQKVSIIYQLSGLSRRLDKFVEYFFSELCKADPEFRDQMGKEIVTKIFDSFESEDSPLSYLDENLTPKEKIAVLKAVLKKFSKSKSLIDSQ